MLRELALVLDLTAYLIVARHTQLSMSGRYWPKAAPQFKLAGDCFVPKAVVGRTAHQD